MSINQEGSWWSNLETEMKAVIIGVLFLGALFLFFVFKPWTIVGSSEKGLKFRMGAIQNQVLDQGIAWHWPLIESIETVSVRPMQLDYQIAVGADASITKDNQSVGADTTVFYAYDSSKLVTMWTQYGEGKIQSLVKSAVKESVKDIIGQYSIYDVAPNQAEIRGKVFASMKAKLANYPINVTELRIQNYDWSPEFDKQIETTMAKAQEVKQAEQDLKKTEQVAQKQVKEAEAAKTALVTKAEGERDAAKLNAEAKALEGEGVRRYNEEVAKNMDLQIKLQQLEIEKIRAQAWNGVSTPTQVWSSVPFSFPAK